MLLTRAHRKQSCGGMVLEDDATTQVELPSEVTALVVQALYNPTSNLVIEKRGLAACSLTCRYWANALQPLLFYSLQLRSRSDAMRLLEFFQRSPHLAGYIRSIHVLQSSRTCSWFHHICKITPFLTANTYFSLTINHPQNLSVTLNHSLKHCKPPVNPFSLFDCPRQYPTSYLQFRHLTIDGVQLRRQQDLVRFIHGLPLLHTCTIRDVKFLEPCVAEAGAQNPTPQRFPRALYRIEVSNCFDGFFSEQLSLASSTIDGGGIWSVEEVWPQAVGALLSLHAPTSRRSVKVSLNHDGAYFHYIQQFIS